MTDLSADDLAYKELAARVIAQNEEARKRFGLASLRMMKATVGEDNVSDIIKHFLGTGGESGAEPVEAGDVDKDAGSAESRPSAENEREESGGGEPQNPPAVVGQ